MQQNHTSESFELFLFVINKHLFYASGFAENEKLHQDLVKVEQLESKITQELDALKEKIDRMTEEMEIYSDIEKLRFDGEAKKKVCVIVEIHILIYLSLWATSLSFYSNPVNLNKVMI